MVRLSQEPRAYQWALPESLEVPPDELQVRLDFYHEAVVMHLVDKGIIITRMVSARDVALALLREVPLASGILPQGALWWGQGKDGVMVALWRPPQVWPVALQMEAFQPPRRLRLPMPGLVFVCQAGRSPLVYAAKRRPTSVEDPIYHAPLFNVFRDGRTCPGTHKYPQDIGEIPESFFMSFFTPTADHAGRSKRYPSNLLRLWEELDGKKRYPLGDMVPLGKLREVIK
jgi:PRTRC genetic system protein B